MFLSIVNWVQNYKQNINFLNCALKNPIRNLLTNMEIKIVTYKKK